MDYIMLRKRILFIEPGTKVYEGMIVGQNPKGDDIEVNVCKRKHVTNIEQRDLMKLKIIAA